MRLTSGYDDRELGMGLPDLMRRLEAINIALEEYCATTKRLERARRARTSTYRDWLNGKARAASVVEDSATSTKVS